MRRRVSPREALAETPVLGEHRLRVVMLAVIERKEQVTVGRGVVGRQLQRAPVGGDGILDPAVNGVDAREIEMHLRQIR
jgi:hypothetical protein